MAQNYNSKKAEAAATVAIESFFKGVGQGVRMLRQGGGALVIFILFTLACGVIFYLRHSILAAFAPGEEFHILKVLLPASLGFPIIMLYIIGSSRTEKAGAFDEVFAQIKFCNKAGEYPQLMQKETKGKEVIYAFRSPGLTINDWRNRRVELETALDCNIVKMEPDLHTKQIVRLYTVPTSQGISTNLAWDNTFIQEKDFEIVAGEGLLDVVSFNLDKYPHALIAGVTGSGKSVILRCMLWQCIVKGARIYMIDFKGGVEFTAFENYGEVLINRKDALELLKELTKEMKLRLQLFKDTGVKNLTEYNRKYSQNQLCRIVLVCDEIAEMLDKTGLAKGDAAIYYEIEKEMSTIARLARAPGINMLLATQRPDAKVLVGQIKNNLPIRISGRMIDPQASEMVLGNTKATELRDILGRFLYSVGSDIFEFQAYNFQDTAIEKGDYQKGSMLLTEPSTADEGINEFEDEDFAEPEEDEVVATNEGFTEFKGF